MTDLQNTEALQQQTDERQLRTEERQQRTDERQRRTDERQESTEERRGNIEARLSRVEEAVTNDIPHRLDALRDRISSLDSWVKGIVIAILGAMGSIIWAASKLGK